MLAFSEDRHALASHGERPSKTRPPGRDIAIAPRMHGFAAPLYSGRRVPYIHTVW
jgi:hypothetical protein